MNLAEAKALGKKRPTRLRVGRGIGSGLGKTSGRGHKGAKARSGWSSRLGWEGGQMPLYRRLPKVGFNNKIFEKVYTVINVSDLEVFDAGATVDLAAVLAKGLTSKEKHSDLFKVLGDGKLGKALTVKADSVTKSAREKIEAAGGKVELIEKKQMRPKFVAKDGTSRKPGSPRLRRPAKSK
ncbi:MAG: 50S ribosomal protein L15 [Planctomycetes bacterium]|nr:50S ribosomal protein L15 [Planctomycetota bacterium]MCC7399168.1 50S ribosomal protein L15 [Planctomycetota bacterium]